MKLDEGVSDIIAEVLLRVLKGVLATREMSVDGPQKTCPIMMFLLVSLFCPLRADATLQEKCDHVKFVLTLIYHSPRKPWKFMNELHRVAKCVGVDVAVPNIDDSLGFDVCFSRQALQQWFELLTTSAIASVFYTDCRRLHTMLKLSVMQEAETQGKMVLAQRVFENIANLATGNAASIMGNFRDFLRPLVHKMNVFPNRAMDQARSKLSALVNRMLNPEKPYVTCKTTRADLEQLKHLTSLQFRDQMRVSTNLYIYKSCAEIAGRFSAKLPAHPLIWTIETYMQTVQPYNLCVAGETLFQRFVRNLLACPEFALIQQAKNIDSSVPLLFRVATINDCDFVSVSHKSPAGTGYQNDPVSSHAFSPKVTIASSYACLVLHIAAISCLVAKRNHTIRCCLACWSHNNHRGR